MVSSTGKPALKSSIDIPPFSSVGGGVGLGMSNQSGIGETTPRNGSPTLPAYYQLAGHALRKAHR